MTLGFDAENIKPCIKLAISLYRGSSCAKSVEDVDTGETRTFSNPNR